MKETKFVNGIRIFKPNPKAPDFVKGNITINRNELMMWLDTQPENIQVDVKESKGGAWYLSVSDYVPKVKTENSWEKEKFIKDMRSIPDGVSVIDADSELPF